MSDSDLVARQQAWLKGILAARREDPTALARHSGLSSTTLTRFLNDPEYPHALSARTVAAIEQATGFAAYQAPAGASEPDAVPFAASSGALWAAVNALLGIGKGLSAWRLNRPTLLGYLPGDVLILDRLAKPAPGDAVAAEARLWPGDADGATLMRVYYPPVLIAASSDNATFPPLIVDDRSVIVRGVIIAVAALRRHPQ